MGKRISRARSLRNIKGCFFFFIFSVTSNGFKSLLAAIRYAETAYIRLRVMGIAVTAGFQEPLGRGSQATGGELLR